MSKTYGFAFTAANLVISILVFVALAAALPSEFFAQAATSKNSTISFAGNSTMTNATDAAQKTTMSQQPQAITAIYTEAGQQPVLVVSSLPTYADQITPFTNIGIVDLIHYRNSSANPLGNQI